jgi:hypothetical protein
MATRSMRVAHNEAVQRKRTAFFAVRLLV